MQTRTLLLTAALSAAGLASAMAQVFSANVVGYVKQDVPGSGSAGVSRLAILAVPLNGTNNELNTTMPLPAGSQDVTIYRFDVPSQNYLDGITWFDGFGWFYPGSVQNATVVNPGEGFWVQNPTGVRLDVSFVGEVPSGTLNNPIPGGNSLKIASSMKPLTAPLGDPSTPDTLLFPAGDGVTVYIFDPDCQCYKDGYEHFPSFGWFSANPDDPGPRGPTIPAGTGFWTQVSGSPRTWTQTFSVN